MKKIFYDAAELVHQTLCIKTNCFSQGTGIPIPNREDVACVDDDLTSAKLAVDYYYRFRKIYGYCPRILCIGGRGPFSKHMLSKTEGKALANYCMKMGIPKKNIIILDKGRHTGENIKAAADFVGKRPIVWCLTKRLSLRMSLSIKAQAPEMDATYYVAEQKLKDVIKTAHNGKSICDSLPLLTEIAAIRQRLVQYRQEGLVAQWSEEIEEAINSQKIISAANILEEEFGLKVAANGTKAGGFVKKLWQFAQMWISLKFTIWERMDSESQEIFNQKKALLFDNSIGYEDFPNMSYIRRIALDNISEKNGISKRRSRPYFGKHNLRNLR